MKYIVDVNVLLPLLVGEHAAQAVAWRWWKQQDDDSVGLCLPVRLGVLRLLTNPLVMKKLAVTPREALSAWDVLQQDPRCFCQDDRSADHELLFRQYVTGSAISPNIWTDAWLAALAVEKLKIELAPPRPQTSAPLTVTTRFLLCFA
jgi:predicted nucleic acid-binding protein